MTDEMMKLRAAVDQGYADCYSKKGLNLFRETKSGTPAHDVAGMYIKERR